MRARRQAEDTDALRRSPEMPKQSKKKRSDKVLLLILKGVIFPLIVVVGGATLVSGVGQKEKDTPSTDVESQKRVATPVAFDSKRETPKKEGKIVAAKDAKRFVGEYCTIEMDVQAASRSKKGTVWLLNSERNFRNSNNFTVMVGEALTRELAEKKGWGAASFVGKRVRVSGAVKVYQDRPEVVVNEMAQFVIVR